MRLADGNKINFFALVPLYKEEMQYKLDIGSDSLIDLLTKNKIDQVIRINRKNVCLPDVY